jgi:hypothetical protein
VVEHIYNPGYAGGIVGGSLSRAGMGKEQETLSEK